MLKAINDFILSRFARFVFPTISDIIFLACFPDFVIISRIHFLKKKKKKKKTAKKIMIND